VKNKSEKYRAWIEAQRRHKLSDAHVQSPLPVFIEECYEKRFGRRVLGAKGLSMAGEADPAAGRAPEPKRPSK
jgi:hypothetical protein